MVQEVTERHALAVNFLGSLPEAEAVRFVDPDFFILSFSVLGWNFLTFDYAQRRFTRNLFVANATKRSGTLDGVERSDSISTRVRNFPEFEETATTTVGVDREIVPDHRASMVDLRHEHRSELGERGPRVADRRRTTRIHLRNPPLDASRRQHLACRGAPPLQRRHRRSRSPMNKTKTA